MGRGSTIFKWAVAAAAMSGCGDATLQQTSPVKVAVFHTQSKVLVSSLSEANATSVRDNVRSHFPAACLDGDRDNDSIPDSLDQDPPTAGLEKEAESGGQNEGTDAGSQETGETEHGGSGDGASTEPGEHPDAPAIEAHDDEIRCRRCNRGPGTAGDFRLEVTNNEARLGRGSVFSRTADVLTVSAPQGFINVQLGDLTQIKDGSPTPGSEVEVQGTIVSAAGATLTIRAKEVDVFCPGPGVVPDGSIPSDAHRVDGDGHAETPPPPAEAPPAEPPPAEPPHTEPR